MQRDRQVTLLEKIKALKNLKSSRAVALALGIGYASYWRLRKGESQSLGEDNLKRIQEYLSLTPEEFEAYLEGALSLDQVTRKLGSQEDPVVEMQKSKGALRVFLEEVLPYLLVPEMLEALKALQQRLFAWLPDYRLVKREEKDEHMARLSMEFGVPIATLEEIREKFKEFIKELGEVPDYELSFAAHDYQVSLDVINELLCLIKAEEQHKTECQGGCK